MISEGCIWCVRTEDISKYTSQLHLLGKLVGKYSNFGSISDNLDASITSHVHAVRYSKVIYFAAGWVWSIGCWWNSVALFLVEIEAKNGGWSVLQH